MGILRSVRSVPRSPPHPPRRFRTRLSTRGGCSRNSTFFMMLMPTCSTGDGITRVRVRVCGGTAPGPAAAAAAAASRGCSQRRCAGYRAAHLHEVVTSLGRVHRCDRQAAHASSRSAACERTRAPPARHRALGRGQGRRDDSVLTLGPSVPAARAEDARGKFLSKAWILKQSHLCQLVQRRFTNKVRC